MNNVDTYIALSKINPPAVENRVSGWLMATPVVAWHCNRFLSIQPHGSNACHFVLLPIFPAICHCKLPLFCLPASPLCALTVSWFVG